MSVYYGWIVVASAVVIQCAMYGAQFSFTVFFPSLLDLTDGSRAKLSGVYTVFGLTYCLFSFVTGAAADRWGPRHVLTLSAIVFAAGLAGSSLASSLGGLYLSFGIVAGVGMSAGYVAPHSTVLRWFRQRRGAALGLVAGGASLGMFVGPPLTLAVIHAAGWRPAFLALAAAVLIIVVPASQVLRHPPGSETSSQQRGAAAPAPARVLAVREITMSPNYWMLTLMCALTWLPLYVMFAHVFPIATTGGLSVSVAAAAVALFGFTGVIGRVGCGVGSDHWDRGRVASLCLLGQAVALLGFSGSRGATSFFASLALFGVASGGLVPLLPGLIGDIFGAVSGGRAVGAVTTVAGTIGMLGPFLAGCLVDAFGSYQVFFLAGAALNFAAAALLRVLLAVSVSEMQAMRC